MTTMLFVRRFLADYVRNPVNMLVLVLVPLVFVIVAAGSMAKAAELFGSAASRPAVETSTAGWAAGILAGVAMYYQVTDARDVDRRLVIAGLSGPRLVTARMIAGLGVAGIVSTTALVALAVRTGIDDPARVAAGTFLFSAIYLGIGALVGARVRNPLNGTVLLLFVWLIDVFLGPTLSGTDRWITRVFPTHYVSLWAVDLPSRHSGRLGDLGISLAWTAAALLAAFVVVNRTTRTANRRHRQPRPGSVRSQVAEAVRMSWRDWRRNPVLWVLLVVVPATFIWLADATTPPGQIPVALTEAGRQATAILDPANIHAATMAPVSEAALATLAGIFVILDARSGDRRLVLVGMRIGAVLTARLAVIGFAALLATAASVAVTAALFDARQWSLFILANVLIALTYGLIGVLLGPIFGKVSGVFIAFLLPFIDIGISQSPMLRSSPDGWASYLPSYGAMRVLVDSGLTDGFDEARSLLLALGWVAALTLAAIALFRHTAHPVTPAQQPSTSTVDSAAR